MRRHWTVYGRDFMEREFRVPVDYDVEDLLGMRRDAQAAGEKGTSTERRAVESVSHKAENNAVERVASVSVPNAMG